MGEERQGVPAAVLRRRYANAWKGIDSLMNATTIIHPDKTLNEIIADVPQALPVLNGFGLDTCCGGSLALEVAVERHKLDLPAVLAALRAVEEKEW